MIDLKLLESDYEFVSTQLKRKGVSEEEIADLRQKYLNFKDARKNYENAKAEHNALSKQYAQELRIRK